MPAASDCCVKLAHDGEEDEKKEEKREEEMPELSRDAHLILSLFSMSVRSGAACTDSEAANS
jgi:hypothetical protein